MKDKAKKIIDKMYLNDPFTKWLGIERVEESVGKSVLRMRVKNEMLNGFGIAHGGITYSLADSALAFASNGHGKMCVSIETSISHMVAVKENDVLTATAEEISIKNKFGVYYVKIVNQHNETVALFKGTVYRKEKDWEI
ncbi:acyl-CoA thioesterase [Flavobacteriales bacterium]|nr:Acyl-coenzyme A thioesterase PaaI [Flavobacteriales bacterium]MCL4815387.1 hotdog fold thioesterase [Flavobacteriales bacterium]WKZ75006.1 MAG: hotdog fold thioesterase [Vicingaceae bacterium]GIK69948.1 MAG: phenylacetic acid degradation protein PaaD [Bacteroidota bacterium]CAG0959912.1 acyl-CoA thioesterase [Flavobacteriales bacterium]